MGVCFENINTKKKKKQSDSFFKDSCKINIPNNNIEKINLSLPGSFELETPNNNVEINWK